MYTNSLFLSHWNAATPICVDKKYVASLKNYHIMGLRFLYTCLRIKGKGAILNHEDGMNFELQISTFLSAIKGTILSKNPILVICTEETICSWYYHLINYSGYSVSLLSLKNVDEVLESSELLIILSTVDNTTALRKLKHLEYFCVVVDDLDKIVTKSVVKQAKSIFNIGLTNRNFLKHPDQKLFWTMLNWSNPGVLGKFPDFCSEDAQYINELRQPYQKWWQRLTWKYCDSFTAPTDIEIQEHRNKINEWSKYHRIASTYIPKAEGNTRVRKRKLPKADVTNNSPKKIQKDTTKETHQLLNCNIKKEELMDIDNHNSPVDTILNDNNIDNFPASDDTIIYDLKHSPKCDLDDNCIISSIITGRQLDTLDVTGNGMKSTLISNTEMSEDDDIVTSIIGINSRKPKLPESDTSSVSCKNELLSLLYGYDK